MSFLSRGKKEIFEIFVSQHKKSKGEKGKFMTKNVEVYFEELLKLDGWKIYYLSTDNGVVSTAFCYENKMVATSTTQVEIMNLIQ